MRYLLWFAFVCSTVVRDVRSSNIEGLDSELEEGERTSQDNETEEYRKNMESSETKADNPGSGNGQDTRSSQATETDEGGENKDVVTNADEKWKRGPSTTDDERGEEEVAGDKGPDTAVFTSMLKYPENQPLELLSYSILEILEREETFAQMLKELVAKIMSIGKDAARVSTDLLILAALSDLAQRIVAHERTLTNYDAVVGKMIEINVSQLAKVVGRTDVVGEGDLK
jgi:hypothetical protein